MSLNSDEQLVLEAITNFLQQDAKLGLANHDEEEHAIERGYEYLHNHIDELFNLKAAESTFFNELTAAFNKVHSYKYLDDPTFLTAYEKEMVARGIPADERHKASTFITDIMNDLRNGESDWAEKDHFHPDMEEIVDVTQPNQDNEFTIEDSDLNEMNIDKQTPEDL